MSPLNALGLFLLLFVWCLICYPRLWKESLFCCLLLSLGVWLVTLNG